MTTCYLEENMEFFFSKENFLAQNRKRDTNLTEDCLVKAMRCLPIQIQTRFFQSNQNKPLFFPPLKMLSVKCFMFTRVKAKTKTSCQTFALFIILKALQRFQNKSITYNMIKCNYK